MNGEDSHIALGGGREFDLIRALVERWGRSAVGIGDDASVLAPPASGALVVSTDATVEDVHFRRAWLTPRELGYRACTAALSDLAAMAATPMGMLLAITLPERWRGDVLAIADGAGEAALAFAAPIVGGNVSGGDQFALTTTVLGAAVRPLPRSACRAGDGIWVTGRLGGPGAALARWLAGGVPDDAWRRRFVHPVARIREAAWLADAGVRSAIDVSDGLVADLGHLAAASGVRIEFDVESVPVLPGLAPAAVLASGEEYELIVSSAKLLDADAFEAAFAVPLTRIGVARAADATLPPVIARLDGQFVDLPGGHDHLSR
ncbi:MAG TPA: thiamine-phosphate kinase [Gemmatimonadaceae bacterium]|nr:thiamine-phosphate kinase [Gemmatimonadaceae bacterium]